MVFQNQAIEIMRTVVRKAHIGHSGNGYAERLVMVLNKITDAYQ